MTVFGSFYEQLNKVLLILYVKDLLWNRIEKTCELKSFLLLGQLSRRYSWYACKLMLVNKEKRK